jgi:hypothetical protein
MLKKKQHLCTISTMNKYPNIRVNVVCLPKQKKEIKKLFFDILADYSNRFSVNVTDKKIEVDIALVEYPDNSESHGLTMFAEDENKLMIQVRDPFLSGWEDNPYTLYKFYDIVCHEFVHAAQSLTGRKGIKVKGLKVNKADEAELYLFDPEEMEARMLELPYTTLYAKDLL